MSNLTPEELEFEKNKEYVLASVVLMAATLHFLLRRAGFRWLWTLSWVVLIVINMSIYLSAVL